MEDFFIKNSPWFFIAYILLREGFPVLGRVLDRIIPERMRKQESQRERELALEEKKADIKEREVVALEQIGKGLAILQNNQEDIEERLSEIMSALRYTNQSLAVLIDRERYKLGETQPIKPVKRPK